VDVELAVDRTAEPCPPEPSVVTLSPIADTYVSALAPTSNFGTLVQVLPDGSPLNIAYLKFDLSAFAGRTVTSAVLRLTTTNPSTSSFAVKEVPDTTWGETIVTFDTRPAAAGVAVVTFTPGTAAQVDLDLTPLVTAKLGQVASFAIEPVVGTDGYGFASDEAAAGRPILTITFSGAIGPPPLAPTNLVAQATSSTRVALMWTDNAIDEDSYLLERCQDAGCVNFVRVATLTANTVTYTDTGLTAGTTYQYRVLAHNDNGDAVSSVASATTATDAPPAPPTGLTVQ